MLTNFNYNGKVIPQREDGFINLIQMCQANEKKLNNWSRAKGTQAYIGEIVSDTQKSVSGKTVGEEKAC